MAVLSVMSDWKTRLFLYEEQYNYSAFANSYLLQTGTFRFHLFLVTMSLQTNDKYNVRETPQCHLQGQTRDN